MSAPRLHGGHFLRFSRALWGTMRDARSLLGKRKDQPQMNIDLHGCDLQNRKLSGPIKVCAWVHPGFTRTALLNENFKERRFSNRRFKKQALGKPPLLVLIHSVAVSGRPD